MSEFAGLRDVLLQGLNQDELERYLQDELRRHQADPITHGYPPHGQQLQFLTDPSRRIIVVAANRVGKTDGQMRDVIWSARGEHPHRKVDPISVIWCGFPDYPSYLRFTKPTFDKWCPTKWMVGDFHESEKWVDIRRVDGGVCRIFFLSYDMPRSKWQGAGVDLIWLDEEPPEDIFNECLARIVTTRGRIVLTFTPVEGVGWWYERVWEPALQDINGWQAYTAALATYDEANEAEHNVGEVLVPHLTREQVVEFAREYPDPDERAIRVFGLVRSRAGLVFKMYRRDVHYIEPFDVPRHWPLWGGVDPGFHGFAAQLFTQGEDGVVYRVAEYYSSHEATSVRLAGMVDMVHQIRPETPDDPSEPWHPYRNPNAHRPRPVYVEPVVFFVDTEDPQTVLELNGAANEAGLAVVFASLDQGLKARKAGILRMQQLFQPVPGRRVPDVVKRAQPSPVGEPLLYLVKHHGSEWKENERLLRGDRLDWEIRRFAWRETSRSGRNPDDANDASAGGAHAASATRYAIMARLGPPTPPESNVRSEAGAPLNPADKAVWDEFDRIEELEQQQAMEAQVWDL